MYIALERYEDALTYLNRALKIQENNPDRNPFIIATTLEGLGTVYTAQARYPEAEGVLQQALSIREAEHGAENLGLTNSLYSLANLYLAQERNEEAIVLYERALAIVEPQLGAEHPATVNLKQAIQSLNPDQQQTEQAQTDPRLAEADRLNQQVIELYQQGKYAEASRIAEQVLAIREAILGDHPDTATSLNNLANLYQRQGRYSEAEPLYKRSLLIREEQLGADHPDTASSLNNLALLYEKQGRYSEAEPLYKRSLAIYEQQLGTDHPLTATSLNNLAGLYEKQGRYSEAEPLYKRSLLIIEEQLGADHPYTASSLNNLALFNWSQDRFDESLGFLARGLEVEETNILANIATLTESQQRDYLSTVEASEDWIVSLHLQHLPSTPQASATALTTILRRKGRILDTLSNSLQRIRANANPEDLARLNQLSQLHTQLTTLLNQGTTREQVQALQTQIDTLQQQLAQNNPEFNPEPVTLEAIRALLPTDAALVEFFQYQPFNPTATRENTPDATGDPRYGEPRYAAYILTPQGNPVGIDLGKAKAIDDRLWLFLLKLIDSSSTSNLQQFSQQVYQAVFQPLEPYLGTAQHLLISPDGGLNLIPFAAIQNPQGQYLLERYQFTALSSGRDLVRYTTAYPGEQPPVILANPNYDGGSDATAVQLVASATRGITKLSDDSSRLPSSSVDESRSVGVPFPWSALPGTDREASLIAPKLPEALILKGNQATEGAVKALRSPSILHFATHGFFLSAGGADENPLVRSGLILTGANLQDASQNQAEDGVLTALEVSGLDLRGTKLVLMSACDTGTGDVANGEGVYGLRRSFTLSGAESQLFSLWEVNDWATQALLTRYYDYILAGRGRSDAWRQTQLDMLQGNLDSEIAPQGLDTITDTAHPNYWAAFVPAGNWEPMTLE